MTISRSTHVAVNGNVSSFLIGGQYSIVCMYCIIFIHSFVNGHLDFFHVLAFLPRSKHILISWLRHHLQWFLSLERKLDKPGQQIKKQKHHFTDKGPYGQNYCFSSSHVPMWELDHVEVWVPKNWCFWTVVLENSFESPLDSKIKPVNPRGNQPWIFIGRTDDEADALILWPPDTRSWFTRKYPDAGKDWGQPEKGVTEDEMVGWHHQLNGHESEQTLGGSRGQRSLVCCSYGIAKSRAHLSDWSITRTCLEYYKQCCNEHWGASILWDHVFFYIWTQEWDYKVIW